ncbi:MAG: DNA polymerase III subunit epsilon [Thiomonas arsenitoxydans]|uniref:DNA polymerase III subunit epsilon n=1 Tax=Thiomonas arsenitoxydans (strain DSM 22701 / CIP 110005 / 3As) TaxID=426114 RepID=A0A8I1MW20_THIA3|nr:MULTISPECIES: DNA polymerase III subunit epsilon [Thiomonas]MBN8743626.1 DNA polymerase III subunit epsilon [Thiomonas arsenitoxydans]ODU98264.1 MAG: DNA polymerase III subunit epsilon [Thiomonas sp. SCN 64-16]
MTRQIVLDTETTGLNPASGDRIIEVAGVELFNRRLTGKHYHVYLNPDRASHPDALKVHGLTEEFLSDKPRFAQIADDLLEFVRDAEIIIHNAPFDCAFLDAELERLNRPAFKQHVPLVTDTLAMAKLQFPGKFNNLDALCKRFGIDNAHRTLHGALLDAELLAEVYLSLTRGQESLVIDLETPQQQMSVASHRLDHFSLPVRAPSSDEQAAHEAFLQLLDKKSQGKSIWRPGAEASQNS